MIQRVLIVGFVMFGVVVIGQTPLFHLDSIPTSVRFKHAPNLTSFDSLKKLPSQLLKRYDMSGDIMIDEKFASSKQKAYTMRVYPVKSNDEMRVVISDTTTKQYLRVYGVDKITLSN
ncbi:hypothetical protein DCS32_12770 [Dokdonia sp. Dokd-P16]|uniref:hypothetical protein n=1 Tax=Dokdonia sp. Dokd-P16 TaxID=2173169 RepID=UPI000D5444EA|nr:hypothetical protein [Dokdonia sp. Dokd-P16]AWH75003.1 hypothetical protein DCS32_12770 [Dokdonia sp. Dokd-P16]